MADQKEQAREVGSRSTTGDAVESWPAYRPDEELALLRLLTLLMRHSRLIGAVGLGCAGLTFLLFLFIRGYEARGSFVLQAPPSAMAQLAGIAAQFGFTAGGPPNAQSIDFYEQLVLSRELLTKAVSTVYRFPTAVNGRDSLSGTFVDLRGIHEPTSQETLMKAVRKLSRAIDVRGDPGSGVVTLTVKAPWPGLAEAVDRRLLDLVSEFNLETRQSNARNERLFVEQRMAQTQRELEAAEGRLARFLEQNRTYGSSPRLLFEQQRLQRQVELRQQVYLALAQAYEQARISEVRDTPVITVVDPPEGSAEPTPKFPLVIALAVVLGAVVGIGTGLTSDLIKRQRRENPREMAEFRAIAAETLGRLSPSRWIGKIRSHNVSR